VKAYKQKVFNGQMPVFDGRKNLYSRDPLPIGREKVCCISLSLCSFIPFLYHTYCSVVSCLCLKNETGGTVYSVYAGHIHIVQCAYVIISIMFL